MLTSNDLLLLIPLVFFAMYAAWITGSAISYRDDLDTEKRSHEMTLDYLDKERRLTRTYRKALQFYALDENWSPDIQTRTPSKAASDQGQTAQLAIGDFFLSPDASAMAPVLSLPEGHEGSLGKYFYRLGSNENPTCNNPFCCCRLRRL